MLKVEDLTVEIPLRDTTIKPVRHISFHLNQGETLGVVGESGCGKSLTSLSLMGLLPAQAEVHAKSLQFFEHDLLTISEKKLRQLRGKEISMIFQDPMTALNPSFTIGFQVMEVLKLHQHLSHREAREQAILMLEKVGITNPASRLDAYPHQISGGMAQRVMIAISLCCRPKLLIADEPTTALDVTIQAQIMNLLKSLQQEFNMGMILISHNLALVANFADRIQIMYAGEIVESGKTADVLTHPKHPYTLGLLQSLPDYHGHHRLSSIRGMVPDLRFRPPGCQFNPRCFKSEEQCRQMHPPLEGEVDKEPTDHQVRCFFPVKPIKNDELKN